MPIKPFLTVPAGSVWGRRLAEPGWLLLPLRAFLGFTFAYAGLQKLANPAYLDPHNPISVASQMRVLRHSSPIGGLLGLSTHAPVLVGLLIAFGELAVGLGVLAGLYVRVAAFGGALLALSFFLTVSWNTTPYYYGSDIVFVFAWLTMVGFGDGGVLSLQSAIGRRARQQRPVRRGSRRPSAAELDRRAALHTATAAALLGGATVLLGGLTAAAGRALGKSRGTRTVQTLTPLTPSSPPAGTGSPNSTQSPTTTVGAAGTAIGKSADVSVGQGRSFTDPATGNPAWVLHLSANTFVAFSAVCTHAGCPVQYDSSAVQFVCPCHGGVYDAKTGNVLQGPPQTPLQQIPVKVIAGQLRVDA